MGDCPGALTVYHGLMVSFFEHGLAGLMPEESLVRSWWRPELRSVDGFKDADDFPTFAGATMAYAEMVGEQRAGELVPVILNDARWRLQHDLLLKLRSDFNQDLFELYAPSEHEEIFDPVGGHLVTLEYVTLDIYGGAHRFGTRVRGLEGYLHSIRAITQAAWWGFRFPFTTGSDELDAWVHEACDTAEEFALPETVRREHLWRERLQLKIQKDRLPWSQRQVAEALIDRPLTEKLSQEEFDEAVANASLTY